MGMRRFDTTCQVSHFKLRDGVDAQMEVQPARNRAWRIKRRIRLRSTAGLTGFDR